VLITGGPTLTSSRRSQGACIFVKMQGANCKFANAGNANFPNLLASPNCHGGSGPTTTARGRLWPNIKPQKEVKLELAQGELRWRCKSAWRTLHYNWLAASVMGSWHAMPGLGRGKRRPANNPPNPGCPARYLVHSVCWEWSHPTRRMHKF